MANIARQPRTIHQIETVIEMRWIVPVELENVILEILILAMGDVKSFSFALLPQPTTASGKSYESISKGYAAELASQPQCRWQVVSDLLMQQWQDRI